MDLLKDRIGEFLEKEYPEPTVCFLVDNEAMEWLDDDWQEEYDEALEWYANCGDGEAEAAIRLRIANDVNREFGVDVEDEDFNFGELLEEKYPVISW